MKKILNSHLSIVFLFILLFAYSCDNLSIKRSSIMAEIAMLKAVLPQELPDTGMSLIDIYFKDDMVVYEFLIPEELWERTTFADPEYSHERLLAGKVATLPDEQLQKYKECKTGIKHIYISAETGKPLKEFEINPDKLVELDQKIRSGEIKMYTLMDNFRMKYEKVTLPIPITKDKWLTEVDFQDNTIHYVITLNNASDVAELLAEDLQNVKAECVAGMKEEVLVVNNEYLFFKENIHLIQTYKDSNGRELAKVVMSPEDLFD